MSQVPKVVFMGTPDFAVPILRALAEHSYDIKAVVTQPDKPFGRKRTLTPPPVKLEAQRLNLPVLQPKKVREEESLQAIADLQPDVMITAAYGQLLPQKLLDIPTVGCINVHASLLPRWRGAAPIHRALLNGDKKTGITLMEMVLELDAGPIISMNELPITVEDNVGTLHDKLAAAGADLLLSSLPDYINGKIQPKPQPDSGITYAHRILSDDEQVEFNNPLDQVHNHVRGLSPWPGARTTWNGLRLKIWQTKPLPVERVSAEQESGDHTPGDQRPVAQASAPKESSKMAPGTAFRTADGKVMVQCADGPLEILRVQPAGKKAMQAAEWFRGIRTGKTVLGENR